MIQNQPTRTSTASSEAADGSRSNQINAVLSVGFAIVAMVFYALSSGLVTIEIKDQAEHAITNIPSLEDNGDTSDN